MPGDEKGKNGIGGAKPKPMEYQVGEAKLHYYCWPWPWSTTDQKFMFRRGIKPSKKQKHRGETGEAANLVLWRDEYRGWQGFLARVRAICSLSMVRHGLDPLYAVCVPLYVRRMRGTSRIIFLRLVCPLCFCNSAACRARSGRYRHVKEVRHAQPSESPACQT